MVQYSLSRSFREEFSYQSGNIEETAYSPTSILSPSNEKRCIDPTSQKNLGNNQVYNEQTPKIPLRRGDLALKQKTEVK